MDFRNKIFVNREPTDEELDDVKDLITSSKVKDYLEKNFIYIYLEDEGDYVQVLAFEDQTVLFTCQEYNLDTKRAVQYIFHAVEIDQAVKETLYWAGIGETKKYIPVIAEAKMSDGMNKIYAEFAVYADDDVEAGIVLNNMDYDGYLYLEDVDE